MFLYSVSVVIAAVSTIRLAISIGVVPTSIVWSIINSTNVNVRVTLMKGLKGFSLIELMVVIAIVALLAAVAVPSYRDYSARAKMTEFYNLLQNQMDYVGQRYSSSNVTAKTITGTGQSLVATPTSSGGTVVVTFTLGTTLSPAFGGAGTTAAVIATYTASEATPGVLTWVCTSITPTATTSAANQASILGYLNNPQCPAFT